MKLQLYFIACCMLAASLHAEDITTAGGKTYRGVTISRAEPDGLVVMTDTGIVKIPFTDLSKELRSRYGYDPVKATQFGEALKAAAVQQQAIATAEKVAAAAAEKARVADIAAKQSEVAQQVENIGKEKEAEAAKQAALQEVTQKPAPGTTSVPGVHVMRISGEVLQVVNGGILIGNWQNQTLEPFRDERGTYHGGAILMDDILFVAGVPDNVVDGAQFSGIVYPAGRYRYKAVNGAVKTVLCYAISPELALKLKSGSKPKNGS